jgi:flagellar M-ring protein FliF
MDILKQQLARIQQQLGLLSASQKMLTASLVAIMVMTFIWWGKYAGVSEMEPVFNTSLSTDDLQRVRDVLRAENIDFQVAGDRILVPTEKRDDAVAVLAYQQVLPKDSSGSFEDVFSKMSPFASERTNEKLYNNMIQQSLADVISRFPGVLAAQVIIDPVHELRIGANVEPSASVSVQMRRGQQADKRLAEAIAETVHGTNAHMKRSRVSVIIDGIVRPVRDRDPNMPDGEIGDEQAKAQERMEANVKKALGAYGEVIAVVYAKIDTVASHKHELIYPKIQAKERSIQDNSTSESTAQPSSAEPGAAANSGQSLSVAPAPADKNSSENTESKVENEVFADRSETESTKPAGEPTAASASVSVPRSYFVAQLKAESGSDKEPTAAEVDAAFVKRRDTIIASTMAAIGIADPKQVSLDLYTDVPLLMAAGAASSSGVAASSSSGISLTLSGHVKEIAVGALALVSLFMVSTMVKKSTPAPVVALAGMEEFTPPPKLGSNVDIAGEVSEGDQALDGMELDEDAIKSQQMVEQVSTMVKENPEAAANMVKRWLNRS